MINLSQQAHFDQRHQERQSRFCSLVFIYALGVQTVSATTSGGIIQGNLQVIIPQEPVESGPGFLEPSILSGCTISLETRGHRSPGFKRLLVEARFLVSLAIKAL